MLLFVIALSHVQGSLPNLGFSEVIATNDVAAGIMYEAIQEALHEVCMLLTRATQAMLWSRSRFAACCNPQLRTSARAFLRTVYHPSVVHSTIWCT
jgi:hypothetical protein